MFILNNWIEECPEIDIMEANTNGIRFTTHCCCETDCTEKRDGSLCLTTTSSHYPTCDHSGIPLGWGGIKRPRRRFNGTNAYGFGPEFLINTARTFTFSASFATNPAGVLTEIVITATQGPHLVTAKNLESAYLASLTAPMQEGMAMAISLWQSTDMLWLDGGVCSAPEHCGLPFVGYTKISNIRTSIIGSAINPLQMMDSEVL